MLGNPRFVFRIKVVFPRAGYDLNDRKGQSVHDGNGKFIAVDEASATIEVLYLKAFFKGCFQFFPSRYDDRPDARTLAGRLDDDGQGKLLFNIGDDSLAILIGKVIGKGSGSNAGALKAALLMTLFMPTALAMTPGPV